MRRSRVLFAIDISDLCALGLVPVGIEALRAVKSGAATVETYKYGQRSGRHMHGHGGNVIDPDNQKLGPTRKARELDPERKVRGRDLARSWTCSGRA